MAILKLAGTTIINEATQPVLIKGGHTEDYCLFHRLHPEKKYTLEYFLNDNNVYNFTFEVGDTMIPVYPDDGPGYLFHPDDLARAEEITIYETLDCQAMGWRISKERGRSQEYQYLADFDAFKTTLRKDASSRIETIETSCARLEELYKRVKICPAQCQNLIRMCSKGIEKMKELYVAVSKNDNYMWRLYTSKKLRHLISSLERLMCTLESIEDLLQGCGSQWCKMGLVVSAIPLPPPGKKTFTEFDLLFKELSWNLDTIHYVLDLTEDVKLNWDANKCRYVKERNQGTGVAAAGGMKPVEKFKSSLVHVYRADLLFQIKKRSIASEAFVNTWATCSFVLVLYGYLLLLQIKDGSFPSGWIFFFLCAICLILTRGEPLIGFLSKITFVSILSMEAPHILLIHLFALFFGAVASISIVVEADFLFQIMNGSISSKDTFFLCGICFVFFKGGLYDILSNIKKGSISSIEEGITDLFLDLLGWIIYFFVQIIIDSLFKINNGSISIQKAFQLLFITLVVLLSCCPMDILLGILEILVLSNETHVHLVYLSCQLISFMGTATLKYDLLLQIMRKSNLNEESFFLPNAVYFVFLTSSIIGILYKMKNAFFSRNEALPILLLFLLCGAISSIHIIGGVNLLFQIKNGTISSNETFDLLRIVCFFYIWSIFHMSSISNIKNGLILTKKAPFMFLLPLLCGAIFLVICGAHHLFQIKNGLFQIKYQSLLSIGEFVLWAICYVFLIRAAHPVRDFHERLSRRYFPSYGDRKYFEEDILMARLQESGKTSESNKSGIVPVCFQIDHEHLNFTSESKIAGDSLKAIYSGYWHGQKVAIGITKILEYGLCEIQEETEKEAALMLRLQHPNVVSFFGYAFTGKAPPPVSSEDDAKPVAAGYLVMELMQGDLRHEIDQLLLKQPGRPFPDDVAVDILLQIVGAMSHVHDCGVIYRDLKAKNCLVSQRSSLKSSSQVVKFYTVKLIDFDISKVLDQDATDHTLMRGTTRWMAPEVWGIGVDVPNACGQKAAYDISIDVYSFGMTCYEVITGLRPFEHKYRRNAELRSALEKEERPVLPPGISCYKPLEELMSRCWAQKPSARPDFKEIQKALWTIKYELELQ